MLYWSEPTACTLKKHKYQNHYGGEDERAVLQPVRDHPDVRSRRTIWGIIEKGLSAGQVARLFEEHSERPGIRYKPTEEVSGSCEAVGVGEGVASVPLVGSFFTSLKTRSGSGSC